MASQANNPEPKFTAIATADREFQAAYDRAAATLPHFIKMMEQREEAIFSAKLRFRDPDASDRLGEDRFAFIWLTSVYYYPDDRVFSGMFFELPAEFQKWHHVGEQLVFDPEDIFDWMVIRDGHLHGGFTIRVSRSRLPEMKVESYDRLIGVSFYEPLPV